MAGTVKKLQFSEGTDVGAPTDLSLATSTTTISEYADDTAFVTANGTANAGDVYINSTSKVLRYYTGSAWRNAVPQMDPADATKTFLIDISGNTTGVSATLAFTATGARVYTFPDVAITVAGRNNAETLTNKTLTSPTINNATLSAPLITTNGSIDVVGAGTLAIGASVGANNISIGGASSTTIIAGNLTVSGTTTTVNSTVVDVADKNITVSKGGNDAASEGSGLTVDRTGTKGSFIYKAASGSKFAIGPLGAELDVVDVSSTQGISNKTFTVCDHDGGTASNTSRLTIPKAAKTTLDGLNRKDATLVFATDTNTVYVDYNSTLNELGGAGVSVTVTQAAHGFVSADLGAPMYLSGSTYIKAKADAANTAEVVGVIGAILNVNQFKLIEAGVVTVDTSISGGALTAGTVYFLSAATAGLITATDPTVVGNISKPIGVANSTTTLVLTNHRGVVVGGSNARTTISLANNATTTVQNVSAYSAGELSGWITIAATTPLQFYVQAQFAKNGAATDYNIAYQTTGDTPPTGFSLTVTSGGLVQAVLPSITGYSSASINYALLAPAVGTSFPLSVQASAVLGRTDGSSVSAGYIGQVITGSLTSPALSGITNCGTVSLTAGSWLIFGGASFTWATGPGINYFKAGISSANNTLPGGQYAEIAYSSTTTLTDILVLSAPPVPVNVSATTTYYLNAQVSATGTGLATIAGNNYFYAIRIA